jgi:Ras-related protein Rab-8A
VDFKIKTIEIENKKIKMQIWDTAGQERFRTITQTYYKGAMGIIMTYAINDRNSFNNINNWMKQIKDHASDHVCLLLIGNKCDSKDRVVDESEGKKLADDYNIPFLETSAKENINVQECFQTIGRDVAEKILANTQIMETYKKAGNIKMQTPAADQNSPGESGGCKC